MKRPDVIKMLASGNVNLVVMLLKGSCLGMKYGYVLNDLLYGIVLSLKKKRIRKHNAHFRVTYLLKNNNRCRPNISSSYLQLQSRLKQRTLNKTV